MLSKLCQLLNCTGLRVSAAFWTGEKTTYLCQAARTI
jgi:hypothetical protein